MKRPLTVVLLFAALAARANADVLVLEQINRTRAALEAARANESEKLVKMKQRYKELDALRDRNEITHDAYQKQRLRIRESYLIARTEFLGKLEEGIRQQVALYGKQRKAVEEPVQKLEETLKDLDLAEGQSEEDLKSLAQTQQLIDMALARNVHVDTSYFSAVQSLAPIHAENLEFIDNELKSIREQLRIHRDTQERLKLLERTADLRLMRAELQSRIAKTALKVTQILLEFETPIAVEFPAWLDPGAIEAPMLDVSAPEYSDPAAGLKNVDAGKILDGRGVDY